MTPTTIILASGTTTENQQYLGPAGTLSYNTQTHRVRVHDGVTVGGFGLVLQAGDTMTGPLSFSGFSHAGLRLHNISTVQRDVLTSLQPGMIIWNINKNRIEYVNQSRVWVTVPAGPLVSPPVAPRETIFRRAINFFRR